MAKELCTAFLCSYGHVYLCPLHAAAPALLEALEALLETTEMNMDDMEPGTLAEIDKARAAIAQAKGAK